MKNEKNVEIDQYLKAVTDMGDTHEVVARQDIYSENGTKLIAAGIRVTHKLYEKLVAHKLQLPLDMSLSVAPTASLNSIISDIQEITQGNQALQSIIEHIRESYDLEAMIASLGLPEPLFFRLTVSKEQFPSIYRRSLFSALLVLFLAHCEKTSKPDARLLVISAMFHNIGMMHVNPNILAPNYRMSSIERRHIYAHPLTAYMLIKDFPELPKVVAEAILEHHERMDGRGYPRGLSADQIGRFGQILGIAVVSAKAFEIDNTDALQKLAVTLKVGARQYGKGLVGHIVNVISQSTFSEDSTGENVGFMEQLNLVTEAFDQFKLVDSANLGKEISDFVKQRILRSRMEFLDAGIDLENVKASLSTFESQPSLAHEYIPLVKEAVWQLRSILLDISRRWPDEAEEMEEDDWLHKLRGLLLSHEYE